MAARICWYCETKAHHALAGPAHQHLKSGEWQAPFVCDECSAMSIGAARLDHFGRPHLPEEAARELQAHDGLLWFPARAAGKAFPHVPDHIAAAADEAHRCHSIQAHRAAVVMARAVVEATAKDKGITTKGLYDKITEMKQQHLISNLVADQAHEIRLFGNDMAHGDFVVPITEEDTREILALMDKVLASVYQEPAQLAALKQARLARQQNTP